jgi:hypothetical protein
MVSIEAQIRVTAAADAPLNPPTHPLNIFKLIGPNDTMTVINSK